MRARSNRSRIIQQQERRPLAGVPRLRPRSPAKPDRNLKHKAEGVILRLCHSDGCHSERSEESLPFREGMGTLGIPHSRVLRFTAPTRPPTTPQLPLDESCSFSPLDGSIILLSHCSDCSQYGTTRSRTINGIRGLSRSGPCTRF